jgi:hypothetical protein
MKTSIPNLTFPAFPDQNTRKASVSPPRYRMFQVRALRKGLSAALQGSNSPICVFQLAQKKLTLLLQKSNTLASLLDNILQVVQFTLGSAKF